MVALGALLIFMMFNSRKKQRAQQEKLATGLVPGARVMTSFGVFGTVLDTDLENNKVTIEAGPGTVLTVHRQAIGTIEAPAAAAGDESVDLPADTQVPDDLSSLEPETREENGSTDGAVPSDEQSDEESTDDGRENGPEGSARG